MNAHHSQKLALAIAVLFTLIFAKNIIANVVVVGELPPDRIVPLLQY